MQNAKNATLVAAVTALALLSACGKKQPPAETAPPAQESAAAAPAAMPHPEPAAAPGAEVDLTGVAKADGGKTVAEIYGEKDQLAGTQVTLRGKVVKTNPDIMGKNWLHVQDGSGEEGTNDLTVTTSAATPAIGATVLVSGTLAVEKDFGMGYVYPVVLEDAEVTVE